MLDVVFLSGGAPNSSAPNGASPVWYLNREQMRSFEEALTCANLYELQQGFSWIARACAGKSVQFCRAVLQQISTLLLRQLAEGGCEDTEAFSLCLRILSDGVYRQRPEQLLPELAACSNQAALELAGRSGETGERPVESRILLHIGRNYTDAGLTLASTAKALGMTGSQVGVRLKRATGLSFSDYLNCVRMEKAKFLLETTEDRVADISAACGFSSARYFAAVFKNCTGLTPVQYRDQTRSGRQSRGDAAGQAGSH